MRNTSESSLWIQYWKQKPGARLRLFSFPYAGGSASIFHNWSERFPPEIEVCPVQLPGRENRLREPAFSRIQPLVDSLTSALLPYLDMPYAFFGHSMGSLISFEFARHLRRAGYGSGLVHLFVSGHRAPQIPDPDAPIYHLPDKDFIEGVRRLNGMPEAVLQNKEFLDMILPLLRADFALCETYTCIDDKPLSCPITAFGGLQDDEAPHDTLAAWKEQTRGQFKLHCFPGDHFFLYKEQDKLLQCLVKDLLDL